MSFPNLLYPIKLGKQVLRNRIVMAPMTRGRAGPTSTANDLMAEYYHQRASAGLIITESAQTSMVARGFFHSPDIYTEEHAQGWKKVTKRVHEKGGVIFCQLWHSGRASHSNFRRGLPEFEGDKALPVAPSAIKRASKSGKMLWTNEAGEVDIETPRALETEEVEKLAEEFRHAAEMAFKAGFDGVEIHAANGFLIDQFLQSSSNKRTDKYGGSLENRFRVLEEIVRAVTTVFEPDCVGVRLGPNSAYNGTGSEDFRESFLYYAKRLEDFGLAYLHVIIGLDFGFHGLGEPMTAAEFRKVYKGTLMVNCGYTPQTAEKVIANGEAELVSFGRAFITNPDFVERVVKGAEMNGDAPYDVIFNSADKVRTSEGYTDFKMLDA